MFTFGHDPDAHRPPPPKDEEFKIVVFGGKHDASMANTIAWKLFFGLGVAAGMIVSGRGKR